MEVRVKKSNRSYISGRSMMLGWTDIVARRRISQRTLQEKNCHLQKVVNRVVRENFVGFEWCSMMVTWQTHSRPHTDDGNVGMSVVLVLGDVPMGQGELFYTGSTDENHVLIARCNQMSLLDGHQEHHTSDYDDLSYTRYSVICFTHKSFKFATDAHRGVLASLGYNLPVMYLPLKLDLADILQQRRNEQFFQERVVFQGTPTSPSSDGEAEGDDGELHTSPSSDGEAGSGGDDNDNSDPSDKGGDDPFDDSDDGDEGCDDDGDIVLNIEHMLQGVIQVSVFPTDSVIVVKGYIRNKCNINRSRQHLVLDDEELDDNGTVEDYGLTKESNLKLVLGVFAAAGGVKKTIQKNKNIDKKMKGLQQELVDGAALLEEAAKKDRDLKELTTRIKNILDHTNALKEALFKLPLPDLLVFQGEYHGTNNMKPRCDMMRDLLFGKKVAEALQTRAQTYEDITELLSTVASVVYETHYGGSHNAKKNTFADLMKERAEELAGVKKGAKAPTRC